MPLTRREMLLASGAALIGPAAATRLFAGPITAAPKKVLFFTKSQTFQHGPITRKDGKLGMAEEILVGLGKKANLEVVPSKDGTMFDPDKIGQWDAFVFYTTGDLTQDGPHHDGPPMSKDGKKAFLDAIRAGKGFVGMHSATDTFHSKSSSELDPYIEMIGAEFISHGDQQKIKIDITDPNFPGASEFGTTSFELLDEWYALKNFQDDLHVIMAYDTATFTKKTGGNKVYDRPNFPETWARMHGKGRVFYTSMGHREDVWENPMYHGLLIGALGWATGKVEASVEPNVSKVTPGYKNLPS
jgi:hypothetical protein